MKTFLSALALVTLSVYGCGEDAAVVDGNTAGTGATSNEAGQANGSGGSDNNTSMGGGEMVVGGADGETGGAPSVNVMCDPEADTVCQNAMDCPFVESGEARMTAGQCGLDCLQSNDENCAIDCIQAAIDISAECGTCYAGAVSCTQMKCLAACIEDPEADKCKACQEAMGCRAAFNTCSGLE